MSFKSALTKLVPASKTTYVATPTRGMKSAKSGALQGAMAKKVKPSAIRQYGDKGYKPSTGKGVGY